ncbi:hypothetical protein AcW1_008732 [Taiwanofungus camphoratus]|nr:hypothetical protein AcW1_008732 [Antrodia cinnamomea]
MVHRRSQSVRYPNMHSPSLASPPLTPSLSFAALGSQLASRKPKSYWYRTTFLALFVLVVVSVYVLLITQPSLSPISIFEADGARAGHPSPRLSPDAFRLAALRHKWPGLPPDNNASRPQVTLDAAQELAAVSSFLASLPQNVIPSSVDPSQPIDPQLVLDFDTRSPHAPEEVETVVRDVWARNPVMLYSKVRPARCCVPCRLTDGVSPHRKIVLLSYFTRIETNPRRHVLTPVSHDYRS